VDKVTYNVIEMNCYGLFIVNPYAYDKKYYYDAYRNTYTLQKDK